MAIYIGSTDCKCIKGPESFERSHSVLNGASSTKMLRHFVIVTLVASCFSTAVLVGAEVASREFLKKQIDVYDLLWRVDQPEMSPEIYSLGTSYDIEGNLGSYKREVSKVVSILPVATIPSDPLFIAGIRYGVLKTLQTRFTAA